MCGFFPRFIRGDFFRIWSEGKKAILYDIMVAGEEYIRNNSGYIFIYCSAEEKKNLTSSIRFSFISFILFIGLILSSEPNAAEIFTSAMKVSNF